MGGGDKQALYRQVAQLHVANIHLGFLSKLGLPFVALMYQAIDEDPDSVLIVAKRDGRVVGFVSGAMGMKAIYRRMLGHAPRLFAALLPSLVRPGRVWRILEIMRYSRGSADPAKLPPAELLSIAVDPSFRGQQIAETLFMQLCGFYRAHGQVQFKIVVGAALEPAHKFYRRMGAVPAAEVEVHQGSRSTVYVCKLI